MLSPPRHPRYAERLTTYIFDHVRPDTLDAHADFIRHQDRGVLQERLGDGRLTYEQLCLMHSGRGLEAAWTNGENQIIFPNVRADLPILGLQALARHLADTASGKRVIVTENLAPVSSAPWEAAGWVLDTHAVMATTELAGRIWPLDPRVQERPVSEVLAPDLLALYAALSTVGTIGDTEQTDPAVAVGDDLTDQGKRLFVIMEGDQALGAAILVPHPRGTGIHMLGVRPERRGAGLGRALHVHLLSLIAQTEARHVGGTDYENHAMRRIFERNGAVIGEQKQWLIPAR